MTAPSRLGAAEIAAAIRAGRLTAEAATRACLERIADREPEIGAWEWLDPDAALAEARARDARPSLGALHGVPVGVKDLMDTADMPTAYGSEIWAGHRPARDAACVAALRAAGAVVLGKTVTTEFAAFAPARTRNPRGAAHTPGGSSSGSSAAVAADMIPLALGTQTVGSIIRPAAFCGVVGFKASRGRLPLDGVKPLAAAFDSLGCFARSVADCALWFAAVSGEAPTPPPERPPRIGLVRTPWWDAAAPETRETVEAAAARLADAGAEVTEPALPVGFDRLAAVQDVLVRAGAAEALATEHRAHRARLSAGLRTLLDEGAALPPARVAAARAETETARAAMADLFAEVDAVLAPAATGEAPEGLGATGDPLFNRAWTLLGGPCVAIPAGRGPRGLPVAVQLAGAPGADGRLLAHALRVAEALGAAAVSAARA
jgi:amidase